MIISDVINRDMCFCRTHSVCDMISVWLLILFHTVFTKYRTWIPDVTCMILASPCSFNLIKWKIPWVKLHVCGYLWRFHDVVCKVYSTIVVVVCLVSHTILPQHQMSFNILSYRCLIIYCSIDDVYIKVSMYINFLRLLALFWIFSVSCTKFSYLH